MSDYEPPAEMVEALREELMSTDILRAFCVRGDGYSETARFVLLRQHERERGLLEALRQIAAREVGLAWHITAADALAAHAKLDAPKVPEAPTLLEAAKALRPGASDNKYLCIPNHDAIWWISLYDALKAAVEREEKR